MSFSRKGGGGHTYGEQGWCNGEDTRLPPMWLGIDSRTRRHMSVEFVVGSLLCSRGFSLGTPVFLSPQKPTFPNSNSIRIFQRTNSHYLWRCHLKFPFDFDFLYFPEFFYDNSPDVAFNFSYRLIFLFTTFISFGVLL